MQLNREPYTGWGRVLSAAGGRARPEKASALEGMVAEQPGPAIGGLRSYGDAALSGTRPAMQMTRLDRFLSFDEEEGVLEAEAGVTIAEILALTAPRGWMPAVIPGTGYATLGGAIAADVHGKNHETAGSFGQHVEQVRLIGPNGKGRSVTPKNAAALLRATIGGMGLTGIIESARIRLAPCPSGEMRVEERRIPNLAAYLDAFDSSNATFSVGLIDATASGASLGRGILEEAEFNLQKAPFHRGKPARTVPFDAPGFALSSPVVRAFNALYYYRVPAGGRRRARPLPEFFHPLDGIGGWNRLYGKRGFHQFQCVLPPEAAPEQLEAMLQEISASGLASPLAVLKKMGAGRAGDLSFPMPGYTLALDFANRPGAPEVIRRLIARTVDAGGRIYLAKDSLTSPEQFEAMYPELEAFRAAVTKADPDGVFETDMARRLKLRGTA